MLDIQRKWQIVGFRTDTFQFEAKKGPSNALKKGI